MDLYDAYGRIIQAPVSSEQVAKSAVNPISTEQPTEGQANQEFQPDQTHSPRIDVGGGHNATEYQTETHHHKRDWFDIVGLVIQTLLWIATTLAFIAAAYYASVAQSTLIEIQTQTASVKKSADAAKSAADTASDQFVLWKQLTEGSDEAICRVIANPFPDDRRIWKVSLFNSGRIAAQNVQADILFSLDRLPDLAQISALRSEKIDVTELLSNSSQPTALEREYILPITSADMGLVYSHRASIVISGSISYNNGFGESRRQAYCFGFVAGIDAKPTTPSYLQKCERIGETLSMVRKKQAHQKSK